MKDKRHALFETEHALETVRTDCIKETLERLATALQGGWGRGSRAGLAEQQNLE
jgi:hypothetical protein